ncbi:MAG TPA: hypothetical protein VK951_00365 [Miltoncostaeaceae bacterium]|nr:hypothetical protein [Miltoncostaeaceae bacterium]
MGFLATAAEPGGALTAIDVAMRPGVGPPSLHAHDPAELVAVQEGTITALRGAPDGPPEHPTGRPHRPWSSGCSPSPRSTG